MKSKLTYLSIVMMVNLLLCGNSYAAPKITQAAVISMGINDIAHVIAVEEFEEPLKLLVVSGNKKVVFSSEFDIGETVDGFSPLNPFLRFKIFTIRYLPSPLILAVLHMPAFNSCFSEIRLIAEINGKFTVINPDGDDKELLLTSQDGIYLGYINKKYGNGMVIGQYKWGDERRLDPHRYSISIFNWDKKKAKFCLRRRFIAKYKYANYCLALKNNKLPCRNIRDDIIRIGDDMTTLGLEPELLENYESTDGSSP